MSQEFINQRKFCEKLLEIAKGKEKEKENFFKYRKRVQVPYSLNTLWEGYFDFDKYFDFLCENPVVLLKYESRVFALAEEICSYDASKSRFGGQEIKMPENFLNVLDIESVASYVNRLLCSQDEREIRKYENVMKYFYIKYPQKKAA